MRTFNKATKIFKLVIIKIIKNQFIKNFKNTIIYIKLNNKLYE